MQRRTMKRIVTGCLVGVVALGSIAASTGQTFTASTDAARDTLSVTGSCAALAGANTGLNTMTFAIHAEGQANDDRWIPHVDIVIPTAQPAPLVPPPGPQDVVGVATAVTCEIIDVDTGEVHGKVAAGQPGPNAVAAGTVEIPRLADVYARVCVSAVFADGARLRSCG